MQSQKKAGKGWDSPYLLYLRKRREIGLLRDFKYYQFEQQAESLKLDTNSAKNAIFAQLNDSSVNLISVRLQIGPCNLTSESTMGKQLVLDNNNQLLPYGDIHNFHKRKSIKQKLLGKQSDNSLN